MSEMIMISTFKHKLFFAIKAYASITITINKQYMVTGCVLKIFMKLFGVFLPKNYGFH